MDYEFTLNLTILDTFLSLSQYTKQKAKKEKLNIDRRTKTVKREQC